MAYRVLLLACLSVSLVLTACNSGRRGGVLPRDSGTADTGTPPGDGSTPDSTIVLMDSSTDTGTMPECSTTNPCPVGQTCVAGMCQMDTMPECATNTDCSTGEVCSGGMCVPDSTRVCEGSDITYNRVAVCSSTTETCISGCSDGTCIQDCLDADPSTDCSACVNQNFISCLNDAGCQTTWDPYVCCIEDNCGTMPSSTCVMSAQSGACASTYGAWDSCTMTASVDTVCPDNAWLFDCF
jgi:hypothetical protein